MNKTVICLIDDNAIFRMIFENMLKNINKDKIHFLGFENALDALDGFEKIHNNKELFPEYIFVDINMPFMTGWEMMDKIQEKKYSFIKQAKIFIISSSNLDTDIENCTNYPFIQEYIIKPITKEKLATLIL